MSICRLWGAMILQEKLGAEHESELGEVQLVVG